QVESSAIAVCRRARGGDVQKNCKLARAEHYVLKNASAILCAGDHAVGLSHFELCGKGRQIARRDVELKHDRISGTAVYRVEKSPAGKIAGLKIAVDQLCLGYSQSTKQRGS